MIQALAAIGAGTTLTLIGLAAWLIYKLVRSHEERHTLRDLLDKRDDEHDDVVRDRDGLVVLLAAVRDDLRKERDLRASVESERNQAYLQGRADAVERIKKANIADANKITAEILAAPLPGWVSQAVPQGRATTPGPDALLNPFEVQPPKDP